MERKISELRKIMLKNHKLKGTHFEGVKKDRKINVKIFLKDRVTQIVDRQNMIN